MINNKAITFKKNSGAVKVKTPNLGIFTAFPILNYFAIYMPIIPFNIKSNQLPKILMKSL